jgi:type IV conjugative transfer system protein TraE
MGEGISLGDDPGDVRVKLTRFLELKEETLRGRGLTRLVILGLLILLFIEGYFLAQARYQERVVLVPLLDRSASIGWQSASPEYLEQLSRYLLPLVTTYHPRSLEVQIREFLNYVSPESFGELKGQLLSQAEEARKSELSQVFYPSEIQAEGDSARATGLLRRFIGKTLTSEEVTTYELCYAIRHGRAYLVGLARIDRVGKADRGGERPCHGEGQR